MAIACIEETSSSNLRHFADVALETARARSNPEYLASARLAAMIYAQTEGLRPNFVRLIAMLVENVRSQADALLQEPSWPDGWNAVAVSIEAVLFVLRSARSADFSLRELAPAVWRLRLIAEELRLARATPSRWLPRSRLRETRS